MGMAGGWTELESNQAPIWAAFAKVGPKAPSADKYSGLLQREPDFQEGKL